MRAVLRVLLPVLVIGACLFVSKQLLQDREPPRRPPIPQSVTRVEGTRLVPQDYQVKVRKRGTVQPRTQTTLIPEVAGKILSISPSLREGGLFEEGDVLLRIDPTDYETAIVVAKASLAQAESALVEEEARAQQALENWNRLGKQGEPSPLVLRKPQLAKALAEVAAAEAKLRQAERDLERCELKAPFPGRTTEKLVDVGQYITPGTVAAKGYAIDYVEVRLPLASEDLEFIELPEHYRGDHEETEGPSVEFTGRISGRESRWQGRIVRVEGAIDADTRQLFVIAQIDDPYRKRDDGTPPLKIGLFLDALITGQPLEEVFVLPRSVVRPSGEIILIDAQSRLRRRIVEPLWRDAEHVILSQAPDTGLQPGEVVCLTPIAFPAEGAPVLATIDGVAPTEELRSSGRPSGRPGAPGSKGAASGARGGEGRPDAGKPAT